MEHIEKYIKEEKINYYEYEEFDKIEEIGKAYRTASWRQSGTYVALKSINMNNGSVNEVINEIKLHSEVDFKSITKFFGITKTNLDEYLLVTEYAEGISLRNYLEKNFQLLNFQDKCRLAIQLSRAIEYLHEKDIVHNDLNSVNILVQQNSIKLTDSGLNQRIRDTSRNLLNSLDTIPYHDPQILNNDLNSMEEGTKNFRHENFPQETRTKKIMLSEKSDVYSVGVILWELSSGKKPFADKEYNLNLAMEIVRGLRESIIEGTPKTYSNLYIGCWDSNPCRRPTIREVVLALESTLKSLSTKNLTSEQEIIQQFKLNCGLFLDGRRIEPSKQAIFAETGILNICLYKGQPSIYTFINDHNSHANLLNFNSNDSKIEPLQPSDVCVNFPIAEITYKAELSKPFLNVMDNDETLHETYGHLFANKILIGGKLFIDDFTSATPTQIDLFKSLLTWIYDSAKCNKEIPFNISSTVKFFPKITTSDGEKLDIPEKLINWMNNLYQKSVANLICYSDLIPISALKSSSSPSVNEIQPGVANFKEKLSLEDWIKGSKYRNLTRWIKKFRLLQGLIINEDSELKISKKISVDFINALPCVRSNDDSYLEMIKVKPTTYLEELLVSNNIFSSEVANNISSLPFIKKDKTGEQNCRDYVHFRIKFERYKILLSKNDIKSSNEFNQDIESALESMKPFTYLQNVFDEYGHFFPLNIVLGRSLNNSMPNSSFTDTFEKIKLESPAFESLKSHIDNIPYFLTQKGEVIEKNSVPDWIQNESDDLEIVERDNIIPLYDILEVEHKRKISTVLNSRGNFKIIMTGIDDLRDLDNNNTEHYKRINVKPPLEDQNYGVFGSIISENNSKLDEFVIKFGLFDLNGFTAIIKSLNTNINITECYILWIITGDPWKLSVFSPKNRELQVKCTKESITLQPDNAYFQIKTSQKLYQGDTILVNIYRSTTNYEPISIKLIGWSEESVNFQIFKSIYNDGDAIETATTINLDLHLCILSSDNKSLRVDNKAKECHIGLIGCTLLEDNFSEKQENENDAPNHVEKEFYGYLEAANNGDKIAQYNLAKCYQHGINTEKDEAKAFEWCSKSAEQEYSDAQNKLGYFYNNGIGIEKDLKQAQYWYQKAAVNGNKFAQFNLGLCYQYGIGIETNEVKAFEWYEKSAEQECSDAQNELGYLYGAGINIRRNLDKAFYWHQKAANNENKIAQYSLARCYQYGIGVIKSEIKAFEWYKKSAEQEHIDAQNQLGYFYENGIGIEKDLKQAFYWYQKAEKSGLHKIE